jgi:glutamate-1-semialdehyde 2,1-aminomutase
MASGLATLQVLSASGFHDNLLAATTQLVEGIEAIAKECGVPLTTNHVTGMFGLFFTETGAVTNFKQATNCDTARFARFFHGMLAAGVYLAPSPFEAGFVSSSHDAQMIDKTLDAVRNVLSSL